MSLVCWTLRPAIADFDAEMWTAVLVLMAMNGMAAAGADLSKSRHNQADGVVVQHHFTSVFEWMEGPASQFKSKWCLLFLLAKKQKPPRCCSRL